MGGGVVEGTLGWSGGFKNIYKPYHPPRVGKKKCNPEIGNEAARGFDTKKVVLQTVAVALNLNDLL